MTARILIVDDDRMLLQALPETLRLRMNEVEVEAVEDATEALRRIAETDYDAVVTDIKMPGIDGLALLERIRELRPEVPTLLITGHGEHDLAVQALRGGAYDFIAKPIDREYFVASLRRALQVRQLRRQVDQQRGELEHHATQLEQIVEERTSAFRLLADASRVFTAAFDPDAGLVNLVRMSVPQVAELSVGFILREDGIVRRLEVAHLDPALEQQVWDHLSQAPIDPARGDPVASVLRTGESLLIPEISDEWLRESGREPHYAKILDDLGIRSAMIVPLLARGRVLGAVTFGSHTRTYAKEDLEFAEALCRRAALAIDNARLYERERAVAETLQRSLLPQSLPTLPGVSTAARYMPATPEAVGGDWYDLFHLPGGRMGLVMGDVAGRGVRVAAVMGQLRNALRAYALEGYSPDAVIKRLTGLIDPSDMATVFYGVFDPATWEVRYANAGHPPPLFIGPDGTARFLEGGAPPLRRARTPVYPGTAAAHLEPGSTVLLYTDGLVETRGMPIDDGLSRLVRAAMGGNGDLEALLDHILADVLHGKPTSDDVALLALKATRLDPSQLSIRLPADPVSVPLIRHALRRWLDQAGIERQDAYHIAVAVCEAASNTVEHAYGLDSGDVEVNASMEGGEVVLSVSDWGQWRPPRGANRGRGLPLVDALMSSVEVVTSPIGTTVSMRRRVSEPARS